MLSNLRQITINTESDAHGLSLKENHERNNLKVQLKRSADVHLF